MGWEAILSMILKFLPTFFSWLFELLKGIKGKPAFAPHLAVVEASHGAQVLDVIIASLQAERAKLAPIAEVA